MRSCHDLSEGGLAVAAAEMAFAGGCGAQVSLAQVPNDMESATDAVLLFSESNTRFLCEVTKENAEAFAAALDDVPCAMIGEVTETGKFEVVGLAQPIPDADSDATENGTPIVIEAEIGELKEVWQKPLDW